MGTNTILQAADCARLAVDVASDGQASDIAMLDLRGVSDFTDYFVVMTAESSRQIEALAHAIEDALEAEGNHLYHREGSAQSGWVLLDFSDVIVHLFRPDEREYYHIEGAWSRGTEAVRIQ